MTRTEFHIKAYNYLCILIAFFLPVYIHVVPALIAVLMVNWVIEGRHSEKLQLILKNKIAWLLMSFYLLHMIGMLWTENKASGWFDLEVKSSLFIFPLIFSSIKIEKRNILKSFVLGCVSAGIISLSLALIHFILTGENHFEYTFFSYILHPTYFAMYVDFAIVVLLFDNKPNGNERNKIINISLFIFLSLIVIMLASKTGTILLGMIIIVFVVHQMIINKKSVFGPIIFSSFVLLILLAIKFFPYTIERIKTGIYIFTHTEQINAESSESNAVRVLIWKTDMDAVKRFWIYGTGTGDVTDELVKLYIGKNYLQLADERLNAHSQIFQTTIALGFAGTAVLFLGFIASALISFKSKNNILLIFTAIAFITFTVESMLEVQAGVMFYSFINSMLIFNHND